MKKFLLVSLLFAAASRMAAAFSCFCRILSLTRSSVSCSPMPSASRRFWPASAASLALGLVVTLRFLGQQHGLDIGQDTALRDSHATQQLVELFVVTDG